MIKEILNKNITYTWEGDIEPVQNEEGFVIKVGKKGGSFKIHGEKGKIGGADWTYDKHLVFPLRYDVQHSYYFHTFFYTEDGTWVEADFGTFPLMDVEISLPLTFMNLENVFLKRNTGLLKNMMHGTPLNPNQIVTMELWIPESSSECELVFKYPYLSDEVVNEQLNAAPQMDKYGQWTVKDWKGKVHSDAELEERLKHARYGELQEYPQKVSKYGGDLSRKVEGTGWFRIHKDGDIYWICDPEGYLLFSKGIDVVSTGESSAIYGLENLLEEIPPKDGLFEKAWRYGEVPTWGYNERVSMISVNLMKVFGDEWYDAWEEITKKRFKSYGLNTIGNFSSLEFAKASKIPYVGQGGFPETKHTIFRSMPDVFSKEYKESARECAKWLLDYKDDPYMIGFFMRNEPDWAFGTYNLASFMMEKEYDFESKAVFIAELVRKYETIENFNKAWNLNLASFSELHNPVEKPCERSEEAKIDTENFTRRMIREYIRVPAEAYRAVDPNHLNLGLRWGWLETDDLIEGCEYCDVFSINCYREAPEKDVYDRIHAITNLPIMIGEFQVGSLDVGNASNGMFGTLNQYERGHFYKYYMEQTASYPYMLGAHYFQLNDQPVIPADYGENMNIGIINVTCCEYEDMTNVMREANARLEDIHAGVIPPTDRRSILVPKEGF